MDNELANIAVYLNLACKKIKKDENLLKYLMGQNTAQTITSPTDSNEETQCLQVGWTLWIANNNDDDTIAQKELLNKLGVDKVHKLVEHVAFYRLRLFEIHNNNVVLSSDNLKEKLLYELIKTDHIDINKQFTQIDTKAPLITTLPQAVKNKVYKLGSLNTGNLEGNSGIVFVIGNYKTDNNSGSKFHAEQKLLAALGELWKKNPCHKRVYIQGCKGACNACKDVLKKVNRKIVEKRFGYINEVVQSKRYEVNLNDRSNVTGVAQLKINHYFPDEKYHLRY